MFYVQCMAGHVFEVPERSELEAKCAERAASGFLDALCLSEKECPECVEDRRGFLQNALSKCAWGNCPTGRDECDNTCHLRNIELAELETIVLPNLRFISKVTAAVKL